MLVYIGFCTIEPTTGVQVVSIITSGPRHWNMAGVTISGGRCRKIGAYFAVAIFSLWAMPLQQSAVAADDVFQQAVNYVFTGRVDPTDGPEIVDRQSCIVVVPEPKFNRFARYYLKRFKMDLARVSKLYAGRQTLYELEVAGDAVLLEYLKADKTTVDYGFKSAHISLPGEISQTERALRLIFSEHCKADQPKSPF
jgi:hypothetical protein